MKKIIVLLFCILLFSQIGFAETSIKVGVVDLQKVVNDSYQVQNLKKEHKLKISELNSIVNKAQAEIAKETDMKKIIEIQDKYTNEFNQKKNEIDKIYASKIASLETKIRTEVEKKAKTGKYDYIFAKSVILYGGEDITNEISSMINKK